MSAYVGLSPRPEALPPRRSDALPTKAERTADAVQRVRDALNDTGERGARAVEKAILVLYSRQTTDEQQTEATRHTNGMGFTGADAPFLSSLAKWIKTSRREPGDRLSPRQRDRARRQLQKYAAQLVRAAAERQTAN